MAITAIRVEETVAELRAAAFCGERAVALFQQSALLAPRLQLGQVLTARLTARDATGGAFLQTESGETLFLTSAPRPAISLGSALRAQVIAEARRDKAARVRLVPADTAPGPPPLETWRAGLPGAADRPFDSDTEGAVEAAFADALATTLPLPSGGCLRLTRTPALTAIDIDSAGRRAGRQAALGINLEAASEAARQASLRNLGGLLVLDCLAPVSQEGGAEIKARFLAPFRQISPRKAQALAPSPFGLMEAALAWGACPIDETYLTQQGLPSPYAIATSGLRQLEREAAARRGDRLALALPASAFSHIAGARDSVLSRLNARYGARLEIRASERAQAEVTCL